MAARPRGGDWLADEIAEWKLGGVETIVSMLEPSEERELQLLEEGYEVLSHGMNFRSFPIPDRDVPHSEVRFHQLLMGLETELNEGRNLVLHCRQGIGRTGLVAAGLFIAQGLDPLETLERLSAARGIPVPETSAQRRWIAHFAETLASAR
jgi:protein-tyrosine phosphatase